MAKQTLLSLVQDILSEGSGDYVNSIVETEESEQAAQIVRTTYWDVIEENHSRWEHLKKLVQLDSSAEETTPTHMRLNSDVYTVHFLRYNKRKDGDTKDKYKDVIYVTPEEFLDIVNERDSASERYTQVSDPSGAEFLIQNDKAPEYYTSFDDTWFIFDSYDSDVDSILQTSKTQCYVSRIPEWVHEDAHVPDLPPQAFSLLLSEAKSVYWNSLKQLPNAKEEQKAARQRRNLNQHSHKINRGQKARQFGRRPKK